jgi:hypothetical protein
VSDGAVSDGAVSDGAVSDGAVSDGTVSDDAAREGEVRPEPYNRRKHYGNTPSRADRAAFGVDSDQVVDHDPPLVKRYYEGDAAHGERPGMEMTDEERRASGGDRTRMGPQPRSDSDRQGQQMSVYSRQRKKELGL